jgi:hypothetical protein
MSLSLYEGKRRQDPALLITLQVANLLFATCTVFMWALMSLLLAEPVRWATEYGIGSRPELFEYPFLLLWAMPVAGSCSAWVAQRAEKFKLAYFLAFYPLLFLSLVVGWYYLAPVQWR